MSRKIKLLLLIVVVLLCGVMIYCGATHARQKPGCRKPADVLTRFDKALHHGDRAEVARCLSTYDQVNADAAGKAADMMLMVKVVDPIIIAGVKKYGANNFIMALSFNGMMLFGVVEGVYPHADLLIKHGTLSFKGNSATYTYIPSKDGKELLSLQPQLAEFETCFNGSAAPDSISYNFVQSHGRWYMQSADAKQIAAESSALPAFKDYCGKVQHAIDISRDLAGILHGDSGCQCQIGSSREILAVMGVARKYCPSRPRELFSSLHPSNGTIANSRRLHTCTPVSRAAC